MEKLDFYLRSYFRQYLVKLFLSIRKKKLILNTFRESSFMYNRMYTFLNCK